MLYVLSGVATRAGLDLVLYSLNCTLYNVLCMLFSVVVVIRKIFNFNCILLIYVLKFLLLLFLSFNVVYDYDFMI